MRTCPEAHWVPPRVKIIYRESMPVDIQTKDAGGWRVEEEFIQAIREGRNGQPSWEEALQYMKFVEAVDIAARTGRTVELSDV